MDIKNPLDEYVLNRSEFYSVHYNDYKDKFYHDYQIKAKLREEWKEYLRGVFGIDSSKTKEYVYSHYRRWYARERARLLRICGGDSKILKDIMNERHNAIMESYEKMGYKIHDCSNPTYQKNKEENVRKSLERYEKKLAEIRDKIRTKYQSESGENRKYDRR